MKIERQGQEIVVQLSQDDLADPVALHAAFEQLILEEGARRLAVDLGTVTDMQSLQLGALVALHLLAYENAAMMRFVNVSEKIKMLFKLLGIDTLLEFHYGRPGASDQGAVTSNQ